MGLIRDALGSALGSNQVNNGFSGGPRLPSMYKDNGRDTGNSSQSSWRQSPSTGQGYGVYADDRDPYSPDEMQGRTGKSPGPRGISYDYGVQSSRQDYPAMSTYPDRGYQSMDWPPPDQMQQSYKGYRNQYSQSGRYESSTSDQRGWDQGQSYDVRSYSNLGNTRDMGNWRNGGFRPLALPQIAYGDGQPFLRGYSNELVQYGISTEEFIRVLDVINVAIIPSPENQIFQKGANIAGWFL
jgi:hypothetical protein